MPLRYGREEPPPGVLTRIARVYVHIRREDPAGDGDRFRQVLALLGLLGVCALMRPKQTSANMTENVVNQCV